MLVFGVGVLEMKISFSATRAHQNLEPNTFFFSKIVSPKILKVLKFAVVQLGLF